MTEPSLPFRTRYAAFVLTNIAIAAFILSPQLRFIPDQRALTLASALIGLFATSTFIISFFALLALPLFALIRRTAALPVIATLYFVAIHFLLYADTIIYSLFRYHLNGLVLNVLLTPGSADSLRLGAGTKLAAAFRLATIAAVVAIAAYGFLRRREPMLRRFRVWPAFVILVLLVIVDKSLFAYGSIARVPAMTIGEKIFPFYFGIHFEEKAERWLSLDPRRVASESSRVLSYPEKQLRVIDSAKRWNVLLVVVEGLRSDMIRPDVMPNLAKRAERAKTFVNHYSGGNATRFGIFALLYGLDGTYWDVFLRARQESLLFSVLRDRGYSFEILSAMNLRFPEFRDTAFVKLEKAITDEWPGARVDRDRLMTDALIKRFDTLTAPWFAFMFYGAPHGFYEFPPEFEKFRPVATHGDYVELAKRDPAASAPLFNRYRNSLLYVDSQLERLFLDLEERDALDETIVIVTGDHGEEFNEFGYFGHTASFDSIQSKTAMIVHVPGHAPERVERLTSHVDVVPTILELAGVENPPSDYSVGSPLLRDVARDYVLVTGWRTAAIIDRDYTLSFRTDAYNPRIEVRENEKYEVVDDPAAVLRARRARLAEVARRMGEFYR